MNGGSTETAVRPGDALLHDQRACWGRGECILVESYVARQPDLRHDCDVLLDLIYHEVMLREEHGDFPTVEEYCLRFPELNEPLRRQFEVHCIWAALRTLDLWAKGPRPPSFPPGADQRCQKPVAFACLDDAISSKLATHLDAPDE